MPRRAKSQQGIGLVTGSAATSCRTFSLYFTGHAAAFADVSRHFSQFYIGCRMVKSARHGATKHDELFSALLNYSSLSRRRHGRELTDLVEWRAHTPPLEMASADRYFSRHELPGRYEAISGWKLLDYIL